MKREHVNCRETRQRWITKTKSVWSLFCGFWRALFFNECVRLQRVASSEAATDTNKRFAFKCDCVELCRRSVPCHGAIRTNSQLHACKAPRCSDTSKRILSMCTSTHEEKWSVLHAGPCFCSSVQTGFIYRIRINCTSFLSTKNNDNLHNWRITQLLHY